MESQEKWVKTSQLHIPLIEVNALISEKIVRWRLITDIKSEKEKKIDSRRSNASPLLLPRVVAACRMRTPLSARPQRCAAGRLLFFNGVGQPEYGQI